MNEQQLKDIEQELLNSMSKEESVEEEIVQRAQDIADRLLSGEKVKEEIEGRELVFTYRSYEKDGKPKIFMTVASPFMYSIGREKYKPYMVDAEIDNEFTMEENLKTVVEAFLRHILGEYKAEELED